MSETQQLIPGLVRIWDQNDDVTGVGFLVSKKTILTCLHVVAQALGTTEVELTPDKGPVSVDFALIPETAPRRQKASIVSLSTIPNRAGLAADIAVLQLDDEPPARSRPLPLSLDSEIRLHHFRTFGFPSVSPHNNGDWADGDIQGVGAAGLLQIKSGSRQGRRVRRGFSGAPVWDVESECVVGMIVEADRDSDDRVAYAIPFWDLSAVLTEFTQLPQCPYRGLKSFREEDSEFFFGHEEFTEYLLTAVRERSLLAVTGPSGVGKSSVVAAGLAAQLRNQDNWHVINMRPGKQPLDALARIMLPLLEPELTPVEQLNKSGLLAKDIRNDGFEACLQIARQGGQLPLLLVIDQFEELFTTSREDDKKEFIDVVVQATNYYRGYGSPDFCIVLTMRTEFLAKALAHPGLAAAISPVATLGGMTDEQLKHVIEKPIQISKSGVKFADGLVARIVQDTPESVQLPLVEFLLTSLWDHRDGSVLTHSAYQELGGVGGALAQHAEQVFNRLPSGEREQTRTVLMRLVTARNDSIPITCRVADRVDFDDADWSLIEYFANQRLLVTSPDRQTVQIVHEALLTKWERLNGWITDNRDRLVVEAELRDAANRWVARKREDSWLLRGRALSEAEARINEFPRETDALIIELIAKSLVVEALNNETRIEWHNETGIKLQNVVRISELTGNADLKIECLTGAIKYYVRMLQPFRAFQFWRRLWQYETASRDLDPPTTTSPWGRAVNNIWLIIAEIVPILAIWLFSWFAASYLINYAIAYQKYSELITMIVAGLGILPIFYLVRRTFEHPLLCFPVVFLFAVSTATIPYTRVWPGESWANAWGWTALTTVMYIALLTYLLWRYVSRRKQEMTAEYPAGF